MNNQIAVSWTFEATHCDPDAPDYIRDERNIHRHQFKAKAYMDVSQHREISAHAIREFLSSTSISLKNLMENGGQDMDTLDIAEYFLSAILEGLKSDTYIKVEVGDGSGCSSIVDNATP